MDKTKQDRADRLRKARIDAGYRFAAEAARRFGWSESTYRSHDNGTRTIDPDDATAYAKAFKSDAAWLLYGNEKNKPEPPPAPEPQPQAKPGTVRPADVEVPSRESMPRDVPVRGTAAGSIIGAIEISADPVDYVRRPPGLANAPDVYAIYVQGESMDPMHPHGELRFVHPGRPVSIGDTVIVLTKDGEHAPETAYIKTLVRRSSNKYTLRQLNPAATIEIPTDKIVSAHKVLTLNDLFGV